MFQIRFLLANILTTEAIVSFARACAAVRGFYKNQKLGKNPHGNDEDTAGKVLLRGEI